MCGVRATHHMRLQFHFITRLSFSMPHIPKVDSPMSFSSLALYSIAYSTKKTGGKILIHGENTPSWWSYIGSSFTGYQKLFFWSEPYTGLSIKAMHTIYLINTEYQKSAPWIVGYIYYSTIYSGCIRSLCR